MKKVSLDDIICHDMQALLCGDKLGSGCFRDVYVYRPDNTKVIKVANCRDGIHHNYVEHEAWYSASDDVKKYMAAVDEISETGAVLIQERTNILPFGEEIVFEMPPFNDLKRSNLGYNSEHRVVIHDLGLNRKTDNLRTHILPENSEWVEFADEVEPAPVGDTENSEQEQAEPESQSPQPELKYPDLYAVAKRQELPISAQRAHTLTRMLSSVLTSKPNNIEDVVRRVTVSDVREATILAAYLRDVSAYRNSLGIGVKVTINCVYAEDSSHFIPEAEDKILPIDGHDVHVYVQTAEEFTPAASGTQYIIFMQHATAYENSISDMLARLPEKDAVRYVAIFCKNKWNS